MSSEILCLQEWEPIVSVKSFHDVTWGECRASLMEQCSEQATVSVKSFHFMMLLLTKGTCRIREQCVPGSHSSSPTQGTKLWGFVFTNTAFYILILFQERQPHCISKVIQNQIKIFHVVMSLPATHCTSRVIQNQIKIFHVVMSLPATKVT